MNKHLAAGHIASWAWLVHYMGGPVRRVLLWRGPDLVSVLKAEEMISADLAANGMNAAFSAACSGHSDYAWHVGCQSLTGSPQGSIHGRLATPGASALREPRSQGARPLAVEA